MMTQILWHLSLVDREIDIYSSNKCHIASLNYLVWKWKILELWGSVVFRHHMSHWTVHNILHKASCNRKKNGTMRKKIKKMKLTFVATDITMIGRYVVSQCTFCVSSFWDDLLSRSDTPHLQKTSSSGLTRISFSIFVSLLEKWMCSKHYIKTRHSVKLWFRLNIIANLF